MSILKSNGRDIRILYAWLCGILVECRADIKKDASAAAAGKNALQPSKLVMSNNGYLYRNREKPYGMSIKNMPFCVIVSIECSRLHWSTSSQDQ